jgi:hypothetical protein
MNDSIRLEAKRKLRGSSDRLFILGGEKHFLFEGSQATPTRPSDKGKIEMNTLW